MLECRLFVAIGNSRKWRGLVLPSSNGFVTARAVASMYGAVVNQGALVSGMQHPCFHDVFVFYREWSAVEIQVNFYGKVPLLFCLLMGIICAVIQELSYLC